MPNVADNVAAETAPDAVTEAVLTVDAETVFATDKLVNVPTDVTLGCALVLKVPVKSPVTIMLPVVTVPATLTSFSTPIPP